MTSLAPDNNPLSSDSTAAVFNVNVEDLYGTSDSAERNEAPYRKLEAKDIARNPVTVDVVAKKSTAASTMAFSLGGHGIKDCQWTTRRQSSVVDLQRRTGQGRSR
jgi:hypothetical protein